MYATAVETSKSESNQLLVRTKQALALVEEAKVVDTSFSKFTSVVNLIKHFTIVKLWLGNCPYYDSRVLIYAHKVCKRLAAGKSYHKENLYKHYILPSLGCIGIVVSVQAFYFDDTSSYHADSMSAVVTIENLNLKDRCANIMSNYSLPPLIHYL